MAFGPRTPRWPYWISGFAICGAIKTGFEGNWINCAILIAAAALCEIVGWDFRRSTTDKGGDA